LSAATIAPERRYGGQDTELEFEAASTAGRPRLVFYYQHTAAIAEGRLARQARTTPAPAVLASPPTAIPDLPDSMQALAWARAERAGVGARRARQPDCLPRPRHPHRPGARIVALSAGIASLLRLTGDYPGAAEALTEALDIYRDIGIRWAAAP
jgi:hypothetical protein